MKAKTNPKNFIRAFLFMLFPMNIAFAQNINYEMLDVAFHRLPLKPLATTSNTYSVSLEDVGADLEPSQRDSLSKALVIPGYSKIAAGGSIKLELIISALTVTSKEINDKPLEIEKDGRKNTIHQYWYQILYSFPAKLRVICEDKLVVDRDLQGFYATEYHPGDKSSVNALQQSYNNDLYFLSRLRKDRIDERVREIKEFLASNYGNGMFSEIINIGYIKDKKGTYEDLTKAHSLIRKAYDYAHGKKNYLDDTFKGSIQEASSILNATLHESSDDKKARIDRKVTAMINYNLALCHYGLNEFDKADEHIAKIGKTAINTMEVARGLKSNLEDRRLRFAANGRTNSVPLSPEMTKSDEEVKAEVLMPSKKKSVTQTTRDYIVSKPGDTLDVRFIIPSGDIMPFGDSIWLQDKIIVAKNDKRTEFFPGEIHGYCYNGVFRESLTWTKDMTTTPWTFEKKFCKRIIPGEIRVFNCYEVKNSFRDPSQKIVGSTMRYTYLDNYLREFNTINFNKWVAKLISGHPELSARVKNGEYQKSDQDFLKIIREYNTWIASKN